MGQSLGSGPCCERASRSGELKVIAQKPAVTLLKQEDVFLGVTPDDCKEACQEAGGVYAIYWGFDQRGGVLRPMCHWNPPERIAEVESWTSADELYTTESGEFAMPPSVGFVGKVWLNQEAIFVPEVRQLSESDFQRKELAARFGIVSVAMKPFGDGVMEVGSSRPWDGHEWAETMTVEDCKWTAKKTGAGYAIYWAFDRAKRALRPMCHWNARQDGASDAYAMKSYMVDIQPGVGFVGKAYEDQCSMFFSDVSQLSQHDFKRKDLAAQSGVVSIAVKPCGKGVMEIGSYEKWKTCDWASAVTVKDCQRAATEAQATFAIYWGFDKLRGILRPMCHWDQQEPAAGVFGERYCTESYRSALLKPGVGFVGKAFRDQETMFFSDVAKLSAAYFERKELAEKHGVASMALKPFANGVMEVGSTVWWPTCKWADSVTVEDCQRACKAAGGAYAIYWGHAPGENVLRPVCHYNPPERAALVKATTWKKDLFTTESYKFEMRPGDSSIVGTAFLAQEAAFYPDVARLPEAAFQRRALAAKFGIASIAVKPFAKGLYEVGFAERRDACAWVDTMGTSECRQACLEVKGSFAIFWGFDSAKGVLRPMCHWNPPECVAQVLAKTGSDKLYTTESYKFQIKPGAGIVGKAYQQKKATLFSDVSQLSAADFQRKNLAEQFSVLSIALKPIANGVLEVGSAAAIELGPWTGA